MAAFSSCALEIKQLTYNTQASVLVIVLKAPIETSIPVTDTLRERSLQHVFVFSGVQVVPHDRTDTPTPPAVDLSMSPSSRHTPSSPEMNNYVPSGVSTTHRCMQALKESFNQLLFTHRNVYNTNIEPSYFLVDV